MVAVEQNKERIPMRKFEVGLRCGGIMEDPSIHYENIQTIEARNEIEAKEIYNRKNNCTFYYAEVLKEIEIKVTVKEFAEDSTYAMWYECETCGCKDILDTFKFCPNCGREIKWKYK